MKNSRQHQTSAISYTDLQLSAKAQQLAAATKLPLISPKQRGNYDNLLIFTPQGLELRLKDPAQTFSIDFLDGKTNYRRLHGGAYQQLIARACAVKKNSAPSILDATAGLGQDAFALACLGCKVQMLERSPVIAALLNDAMQRLRANAILGRHLSLRLTQADACQFMATLAGQQKPDIVYLDPMHPPRRKSALVKKEMRLLRRMVGSDDDTEPLFTQALACAGKRIVVKRPRLAETISVRKADVVYTGKSSRFDVYFVKN